MPQTIGYIMSRFPKITETFILNEMVALEQSGQVIELFPLVREKSPVQHPEAARFLEKAFFPQWKSAAFWQAQLTWLTRQPSQLLDIWRETLWGNRNSLKFLIRTAAAVLAGTAFAEEMVQRGVDHIHAHWATHSATAAYVAHRLTGIPYSFTGHAHDIYVNRAMLAEKVRAAAFMVTISDFNRAFLTKQLGPELGQKIKVIRCGVDTDLFKPLSRPQTASPDRPLHILCIGSLEAKKGQTFLVEACRLLRERAIPFCCTLIGDGGQRAALTQQIEDAGLSNQITLRGQQPRTVVLEALREADVVVMPSITLPSGKKEGIPVALMEALAMGIPAVASQLSGIPELIEDGETGLLVAEQDPLALANALQKLAEQPELRDQLRRAGRQKVLASYDLRRNAEQLQAAFETHGKQPVLA